MGPRRRARVTAFQALYAWEDSHLDRERLLKFEWLDKKLEGEAAVFASLLVSGTLDQIDSIDETIKMHLKRWSFDRLARVDLANIRTGVFSLLYQKDIPASVTLDEAIEIAKEYGSPDSYRFVNGVLDGIYKTSL